MQDPTDPEKLFAYHRPTPENVERIRTIRKAHKELGALIYQTVDACPERTLALRALHQCAMHANYAIVRNDAVAD